MTTVRTIKLKRSSPAYGEPAGSVNLSTPATPEPASPATPSVDAPAMAPLEPSGATSQAVATANAPAAAVAIKTAPGKSAVWFMLIALTAVIGLLIILGLQYSEMSFYKLAPSVWMPGH